MSPLKRKIFTEIRSMNKDLELIDDEDLCSVYFRRHDSMRLTLSGFLAIKERFTAYSFPVPEDIKTKHFIGLSHMEFPYFLTTKRLVLFSEMDAMTIELHGGLLKFLEVYSK